MSARIISEFNRVVAAQFAAADLVNGDFVAAVFPRNDNGARITGITFGIDVDPSTTLDYGALGFVVLNYLPNPNTSISTQLGGGISAPVLSESRYQMPYSRQSHNLPFDRSDEFDTPIEIPAGINFSVICAPILHTGLGALTLTVYLSVRGEMSTSPKHTILRS